MLGFHICQEAVWFDQHRSRNEGPILYFKTTYLKALEFEVVSRVGGVPVREEAPESSPGRPREPPGPRRRPLLLREENIDVGPRVTCWLDVLLAEPFRRLKSSMPTWLLVCCA